MMRECGRRRSGRIIARDISDQGLKGRYIMDDLSGTIIKLLHMADTVDECSSGRIDGEEKGLRGMLQMDMMVSAFRVADDVPVTEKEAEFISECFEEDHPILYLETLREKVRGMKVGYEVKTIPFLAYFDTITESTFGRAYIQILSLFIWGYLINSTDGLGVNDMVRLVRHIENYTDAMEEITGKKVDFNPIDMFGDDRRAFWNDVLSADKRLHEKPESYEVIVRLGKQAIKNLTKDGDTEEEADNKPSEEAISNTPNEDCSPVDVALELDTMVGLSDIKGHVKSMMNLQIMNEECKKAGIKRPAISKHMIFTGNPGTGKTSMARLISKLYFQCGLLKTDIFVEVSRADLVGKYVGHTSKQVDEIVERTKGGVLFIDEAYSLFKYSDSDYGHEAIETLIKRMEDYRDNLIVIVAGYPKLMEEFLDSNPGFRSRFGTEIRFPDYNAGELLQIFEKFCEEYGIVTSAKLKERVHNDFENEIAKKDKYFGNAKMVRNYFEATLANQANRLVGAGSYNKKNLQRFILADLPSKKIEIDMSKVTFDFVV